ncbi:unnamed protein product, partial [Thlaspi arvense]
ALFPKFRSSSLLFVRMCIVGNKKGNRALKEIGTFMMTTCFIANYQSVQVCQAEYFRQLLKPLVTEQLEAYTEAKSSCRELSSSQFRTSFFFLLPLPLHGFLMQRDQFPHFSDEMGDGNMNHPYASASSFDALFPPCAKLPYHGVELQPSPVCPKNFVIFDQNYDRSQVMYHPELTHKLMNSPTLNGFASTFHNEYVGGSYGNFGQEVSSSHQEDPNEIDALLSTDEDYEDDDDDENEDGGDSEEVSTARNSSREYGNTSAESCCSSYGYKSSRKQSLSGSASCNNDGKGRKKMKKMMGVLRRIVPGGEQMNTACVLDEAVQYLKSLKLEAQKLGVGHFSNQS